MPLTGLGAHRGLTERIDLANHLGADHGTLASSWVSAEESTDLADGGGTHPGRDVSVCLNNRVVPVA
jgi:hypothetical protein